MAANRKTKTKPIAADLPDARGGVPKMVRNIKLPEARGKAKAARGTIAERQATAACFQPLPPGSTFAAFLLSRMEPGSGLPGPDGTVLQKYTGLLLTIAQEQFAYCGRTDSAQKIRTGHFFWSPSRCCLAGNCF